MRLRKIAKKAVLRLPVRIRSGVMRWHYERVLRGFEPDGEPALRVVRLLALPGTCAVDVGASIGVYTRVLSQCVGRDGIVFALEPVPSTCEVLEHNVRRLGLANVCILRLAASDVMGDAVVSVPIGEVGEWQHYLATLEVAPGPCHSIRVRTDTLDNLTKGCDRPISFIKCDVEGHELPCLRGAARMLAVAHPAWLVGINHDQSPEVRAAVFDLMQRQGYEVYWYDGVLLRRGREENTGVNFFFLTTGHVRRMRSAGLRLEVGAQ